MQMIQLYLSVKVMKLINFSSIINFPQWRQNLDGAKSPDAKTEVVTVGPRELRDKKVRGAAAEYHRS